MRSLEQIGLVALPPLVDKYKKSFGEQCATCYAKQCLARDTNGRLPRFGIKGQNLGYVGTAYAM